MNKELRRCPFCGGEAEIVTHLYYSVKTEREELDSVHIQCKTCQSQGYAFWGTEEHAIEAWNRREPMDKIVEQLEEIQMGEYSAKAEYVQGMNGNSIAYCDGAISTIEKAIEIVKGGAV